MKKAFTMMELVFVIVVVGILSAMIAPNFQRNSLREAADQVISHIRYTQHLAMMDDKFDPSDPNWYLGRWQMVFAKNLGSDNKWSYTIFSDWKGVHDGNPNPATSTITSEIAYNPLDITRYLTGGTSGTSLIHYDDKEATIELNIGHKYGVTSITLVGGNTGSPAKRVIFDNLGRPYRGSTNSSGTSVISSSADRLAKSKIYIKLCTKPCTNPKNKINNQNESVIVIEPETGYTHIL